MLIRLCFQCKHHEIRKDGIREMSHCRKENCWSRYSKCIAAKALARFLEQECQDAGRPFSALSFVYPPE